MDALKVAMDCVTQAEALNEPPYDRRAEEKAAKLYATARIKCYDAGLAFKLADPEYDPELRDSLYEAPDESEDEVEMELVEPEESDEDEPDEASDDSDDESEANQKEPGEPEEPEKPEDSNGPEESDRESYSSDEESDESEIDAELEEDLSVLERESKEEIHVLVEPIYGASLRQPTFEEVCTLASMRCEAMSEYCKGAIRPLADAHATRVLVGDATQRFQQEVSPLSVTTMDLLDLPFPMPFEQAQMDLERIKDRMDDRAFVTARVDRRNHAKLKAELAARIAAFDSSGKWSTLATLTDKVGKQANAVQTSLQERKNVSTARRPETKFSKQLEWSDGHGFCRRFELDEYIIALTQRMNDEGASLVVAITDKKLASPSEYSIVALRTTVSSFEAIAASASNILILEEEPANKTVAKQIRLKVLRLLNTHLMSDLHVDFEIRVLAAPLPVLMKKVARGMDHKQRLKQERLQLETAKGTIDRLNAQIRAFPPPNDDGQRGDAEDRRVVRSQRSGSVPPRFKPY